MKYLISYQNGVFGLKSELENGDDFYAEVPDDFAFQPGKTYRVFSDRKYEVVDRIKKVESDVFEELG